METHQSYVSSKLVMISQQSHQNKQGKAHACMTVYELVLPLELFAACNMSLMETYLDYQVFRIQAKHEYCL